MIKRTLTIAAATLALAGATLAATAGTAGATATHWTPGDKRLCGEFSFPRTHATVPAIRELAYDATYANGWLQSDAYALAATALARRPYGKALRQVEWDCN